MPNSPDDMFADATMPSFTTATASVGPTAVAPDDRTGPAQTPPAAAAPVAQTIAPFASPVAIAVAPFAPPMAPALPPRVAAIHRPDAAPIQPARPAENPQLAQLRPPAAYHAPFLQKRWVLNTISFGTSISLHVILVLLGLVTYKAAAQYIERNQEQSIVPSSDMAPDGMPGGSLHPGLGDDPNRDSAQDAVKDTPADHTGWADRPGDSLADVLVGGGSGNDAAASEIAMGLSGRGNGSNDTGMGATGQIAPWGPPGGGAGQGPKTNFLLSGGNALSVIYVCDASGSMDTKFDLLRRELEESIDHLEPIQQFNVVFFNQGKAYPLYAGSLLQARADSKSSAYRFIDAMELHGGSDPLAAINAAFAQRPQLIYLLTDGGFPNDDDVRTRIATLNGRRATKINTILLMGKRTEETGLATFMKVMKRIAAENGGMFSSLSVEDF